jgi:hypothetical protein
VTSIVRHCSSLTDDRPHANVFYELASARTCSASEMSSVRTVASCPLASQYTEACDLMPTSSTHALKAPVLPRHRSCRASVHASQASVPQTQTSQLSTHLVPSSEMHGHVHIYKAAQCRNCALSKQQGCWLRLSSHRLGRSFAGRVASSTAYIRHKMTRQRRRV